MMNGMLRRAAAVCLTAITLMSVTSLASAAEGKVDTSSLVLRKSATKSSKALQTLERGDEVDIISEQGDWYKVRYGSYTGYVMKEYLKVTGEVPKAEEPKAEETKPDGSASSTATLRPGDTGQRVKDLQTRLKELGYYTGSIDGKYGNGTKKAVKAFQKKMNLTQDGIAGAKTLTALAGADASAAQPEDTALRPGDSGDRVKALQRKLKELGLYTGSVDGKYGDGTAAAVKALQKAKNLTAGGVAGAQTLDVLDKASKDDFTTKTERLSWFGHENTIPKNAVFTVKDVKTGKTFKVRRWSGVNHLDGEPLTAEDSAIMKDIYGGSWSWDRRAILVKYDGHVYAASMNGMPHGTDTISGNDFNGHFCIHFYNSRTHETNRVDEDHQAAVAQAMNASWE